MDGVGLFGKRSPVLATVAGRPLRCLVCGGPEFWHREVKLNSTGMELFDLGWANQSALGLLCATRGCATLVAGEYGEHPDTAASRMSWALATVRAVYTTPPDTPVAALPGRLVQRLAYCA